MQLMKRDYIIFIALFILVSIGCNETNNTSTQLNSVDSSNNTKIALNNTNINTSIVKQNIVIDKAQKDYQDSYNEYVRCLREKGPQTVETLQALTIYQKNYQIYQMLLKAESEKK